MTEPTAPIAAMAPLDDAKSPEAAAAIKADFVDLQYGCRTPR
jgi:hypothetical protein